MSGSYAYDSSYLRTIFGILRICTLLCSLIGFNCIIFSSVPVHNFRGCFYISVAVFGYCCSTVVLLARLFQVWERKFHNFQAFKYETYLHSFLAVAFFIASALSLSLAVVTYSVATFFGYLTSCFYAADAYLSYRQSRICNVATQTPEVGWVV
ncbi:uncharacterized protein LOC119672030 [Teleopsis dalmanni]|uniref:uncharacterized protein LOC119672030 n=1 Tax=Teleopsis dalmanni TaxID=139649 RepID=UPI000D32CA29|nr:uncharacterized protein LOC119672030 [Teleopsis dalmanni]